MNHICVHLCSSVVRFSGKREVRMGVLQPLRTGKGPMDGWIARAYDQGVQAAFRDVFPGARRGSLRRHRRHSPRAGRRLRSRPVHHSDRRAPTRRGDLGHRPGADDDRAGAPPRRGVARRRPAALRGRRRGAPAVSRRPVRRRRSAAVRSSTGPTRWARCARSIACSRRAAARSLAR